MKGKISGITAAFTVFLLIFYMAIILYVFFGVIHIDVLDNFIAGLVFELIGFIILSAQILGNLIFRTMKNGYLIPFIFTTIIYTLLLNLLNTVAIMAVVSSIFVLLHLVLLFVYCLVSIPLYVMGKR